MSTFSDKEKYQQLKRLALRLRSDDDYMASVLAAYEDQEKLDESELARRLAMEANRLPLLALCKRPRSEGDRFGPEVRQIASYAGADVMVLAQIIRQVDAILRIREMPENARRIDERSAPTAMSPFMAAARDRQEGDAESTSEEEKASSQDTDEE